MDQIDYFKVTIHRVFRHHHDGVVDGLEYCVVVAVVAAVVAGGQVVHHIGYKGNCAPQGDMILIYE